MTMSHTSIHFRKESLGSATLRRPFIPPPWLTHGRATLVVVYSIPCVYRLLEVRNCLRPSV